MYLHIGNEIILKRENIIFILDYENFNKNSICQNFFKKIDKKNVIDISKGKPKSIVITKEKEIIKAYISNISSNTLGKRNVYK